MGRSAPLWLSLFLISACAAKPVNLALPDDVVGNVSGARYTGWNLDLCNKGQVTQSLPACAPLGAAVYEMEIYEVHVRDVRTAQGGFVSPQMVVGLLSHALRHDYRRRESLHLERAPDNFRAATGIEYLAWARK